MNFRIEQGNIPVMDLHMHTAYSDGADSPSDMLRSAARSGFKVIGISDHSYTFFDESYCISKDKVRDYYNDLSTLKNRCLDLKNNPRFSKALGTDSIEFYIGIEQDYYSTYPTHFFDYVIGSVHYIRLVDTGKTVPCGCLKYDRHVYIPVDESPEILKAACDTYYGGDIYSLIEDYFLIESDVVNKTEADIIGHFDLISKFNENGELFDPENERYVNAWKRAAYELTLTHAYFEINTGAVSRGYRTNPYPSTEMISFIKTHKGRFILSSDAHSKESTGFSFEKYRDLLY